MLPAYIHSSIKSRHSETHRLIFLSMDVEDVALLHSPCMRVHEERLPIDHILQICTKATKYRSASTERSNFIIRRQPHA